jgi:hypothetical protein
MLCGRSESGSVCGEDINAEPEVNIYWGFVMMAGTVTYVCEDEV